MDDRFKQRLTSLDMRIQRRREQHKADVAFVKEHYPDIAGWLTEFASLFGKEQMNYRVVLRK